MESATETQSQAGNCESPIAVSTICPFLRKTAGGLRTGVRQSVSWTNSATQCLNY